ncbi:hypothetical protein BDV37DRAFT_266303 [Aspergillus pseudonomiae]|uniref:Uncharacterized protein n=1 Tax=Aspergillus pseudonomiae TaxID=1506151 RepID=A0A5N7CT98_9EURO|nr:uncharacterized protein BDV37DRAFT_266303 [Aspergillus pseudonomiae]KAE8397179.1 hypothetical protein BDV37DRAFT_266303 [Aspergillus pseudonomiae]
MPLSRRGHCVIDRIWCWASISSPEAHRLPLRPSIIQLPLQNCPQPSRRIHHLRRPLFVNPPRTRDSITVSPAAPLQPTILRTMSDDAYMNFLNKANADLDTARAQQAQDSPTVRTETVETGVHVPAPLTSVDAYYISETDAPFEPVALRWEGASKGIFPDPSHLSRLISPNADLSSSITTLSPSSFDPRNQYPSALRAVRAAAAESSGGDESAVDVKVYRVEVGMSRIEYYILAVDAEKSLLVGLRTKAVET